MAIRSLSVLDQSPIPEGAGGAAALRNSVDLAQLADELGYMRYWVAEHHGMPMLASSSPEVLIAAIAGATSRMRVGSGGVMLPHYSPYKVAENFSILSGLHPGRVDLGLGRAPGTDRQTMVALQRDRRQWAPDDFTEQLTELLAYFEDTFPEEHPFGRLTSLPGRPERPEVWLLGSSLQSAIWAAELGLPYCFADFINPDGPEIADAYRERFAVATRLPAPRIIVAVAVICADTAEEADRLASSQRMSWALRHTGQFIEVPPVEKALEFLRSNPRPPSRPGGRRRQVLGDPPAVRSGLEEIAEVYGAEEVMVVTITHDHGARRRSYELIAAAFGLEPQYGLARASKRGASDVESSEGNEIAAGFPSDT